MSVRIGVDTGGTFTDLLCLDEHGLRLYKLRSTPGEPSVAILDGIRSILEDRKGAEPLEITHGSTVATNAVLERKGAKVALITTRGFEDVILIGRQARPELYNFMVQRPDPLVASDLTFGASERLAADGRVVTALKDEDVDGLIDDLKSVPVESVALCLLHSYANAAHEQKIATALREAGFRVSVSSEVLPEYREYERWSTTVVNAYVAPLMQSYLTRLQEKMPGQHLRVMQSNGGSISAKRACTDAVQTILSGPAAGLIGAHAVGEASGFKKLITFDMGGTSTDVSLVDGEIGITNESMIGDLPVRLPVLDIHTVGAGGGSVAWIDSGGGLRVGPRSAGAEPGPVCFGAGDELTVTDANLLLGRLDSEFFLGGRMALDIARTKAVAKRLAAALKLSVPALAEGIVKIANANMDRAVRAISVQRGHDPRDFALLAFGGAGGLHACGVAALLEITTVLIPEHAGVLSAYGMLLADVVKDYSASLLMPTRLITKKTIEERREPLLLRATAELGSEGFRGEDVTTATSLAMRYRGQAFEIDVPLMDYMAKDGIAAITAEFHRRHDKLYGYSNTERETEVVQLKLRATGCTSKPVVRAAGEVSTPLPARRKVRPVIFGRRAVETPLYHRDELTAGMGGEGPAIVISGHSTNVFPPGWSWRIDGTGTTVARALAASATRGARA